MANFQGDKQKVRAILDSVKNGIGEEDGTAGRRHGPLGNLGSGGDARRHRKVSISNFV